MKNTDEKKIGCLLMAAGNSTRFATNKLMAEFQGKPLIRHALEAVPKAWLSRVVVVTQYPTIGQMAREYGFEVIENDHPEWGAAYTVRLGTQAMHECNAIIYMVADQPLLDSASLERVIETWRGHPCNIVAAAHDGVPGNPCIFPREFYGELESLQGDVGGKAVIHKNKEKLLPVEIAPEELIDCDTPQSLRELERLYG